MESFKLKPINVINSIQFSNSKSNNNNNNNNKNNHFFKLTTLSNNYKPNSTSISCSSYSKQQPPNNNNNKIPKKPNFLSINSLCSSSIVVTLLQSIKKLISYNVEGYNYQNGAFGVAILSMTSTAKCRLSPIISTLAANPTFISGMFAWIVAQSLKVFLNFWVERNWDFRILFASGGMPSSHSALCTALTTSVALSHGVADSLFPVCLGFSLIVMYDAIGVRRHAGMQAEDYELDQLALIVFQLLIQSIMLLVLNMIVEDLFQGHPISQRKLKELLGHTPLQVFAGAMLGILVACFCCQGYLVAT
ncbi:hypothetical protein ACFE04_016805 [Oxalis oulophora]